MIPYNFKVSEQPSKGKVPEDGFVNSCGVWKVVYEDENYLIVKRNSRGQDPWYTKHTWSKFLWWEYWSNLSGWSGDFDTLFKGIEKYNDPNWRNI